VKRSLLIGLSLLLAAVLHAQKETIVYDGLIGLIHEIREDTVLIKQMEKNLPADRAGLRTEDKIIEIDGEKVSGIGLTLSKLNNYFDGRGGDPIHFTLKRTGVDSLLHLTVIRDVSLAIYVSCNLEYLVDSTRHWTIKDIVSDSINHLFSTLVDKEQIVYSVERGSIAEAAGLKPGDKLISLSDEFQIVGPFQSLRSNDTSLSVLRDSTVIKSDFDFTKGNKLTGFVSQFYHDLTYPVLWYRIDLKNYITEDRTYLMYFFGPDSLTVYEDTGTGTYVGKRTGSLISNEEKDFTLKKESVVRVQLKKDAKQTFYVQMYSHAQIWPLITLRAFDYITKYDKLERLILGAFYGMMLIMALYYLILFFFVWERSYLWYSLFILNTTCALFFDSGYLAEIHSTNTYLIYITSENLLLAMCFIFFNLFGLTYLNIRQTLKTWHKIIVSYLSFLSAIALLYFIRSLPGIRAHGFTNFDDIVEIIFGIAVTVSAVGLIVPTILSIKKRFKPAWHFLIAQGIFLVLLIYLIVFPPNLFSSEFSQVMYNGSLHLGIIFQFLVFSAGLGQKMRTTEKERQEAQERIIEQLKENEQLKDKVNRELEQKVRERTKEIVQQKEEIEAQRDELESQRDMLVDQKQEITDSINYARRIQTAVLPSKEMLDELLPEHFVLYKPRDIVSGDFYWIRQIKNFTIVVVADCTGHGVPGAFMSMLGISLLNDHVSKSRFDRAGEVLDRLRKKVKETLQQEGRAQEQKDGMDMALAMVNNENLELQFAGAFNPIYIVRKKDPAEKDLTIDLLSMESDDFILLEIKGDRQPIAIHTSEHDFTTQTFPLRKDDRVYLFSDGYCDQMGGPQGRKFMTHQFKELLLRIQDQPLDKQRILLDQTLENWMGSMQQIDDILVLGIRWK
jgi:serine phosphatase RsbU (regulator of sigma subunit)